MRAVHTSLLSYAMEVRPNSHPECTGRHMTGTLSDGTVVHAAIVNVALGRDIGPYTDRESNIERLITRRTRRLADARENLKDRLHSYIELLSRFGPCGLFPVTTVEILTERSPISDDRRDRRKLDTGPSRHPTKQVPGRIPEMEKTLGAVYQEWRGVL